MNLKTSSLRVGESMVVPNGDGELVVRLHECGRGEFEASLELPPGGRVNADVDDSGNLRIYNDDTEKLLVRMYIRRQNVAGQVAAAPGTRINRINGDVHTL